MSNRTATPRPHPGRTAPSCLRTLALCYLVPGAGTTDGCDSNLCDALDSVTAASWAAGSFALLGLLASGVRAQQDWARAAGRPTLGPRAAKALDRGAALAAAVPAFLCLCIALGTWDRHKGEIQRCAGAGGVQAEALPGLVAKCTDYGGGAPAAPAAVTATSSTVRTTGATTMVVPRSTQFAAAASRCRADFPGELYYNIVRDGEVVLTRCTAIDCVCVEFDNGEAVKVTSYRASTNDADEPAATEPGQPAAAAEPSSAQLELGPAGTGYVQTAFALACLCVAAAVETWSVYTAAAATSTDAAAASVARQQPVPERPIYAVPHDSGAVVGIPAGPHGGATCTGPATAGKSLNGLLADAPAASPLAPAAPTGAPTAGAPPSKSLNGLLADAPRSAEV